MNKSIIIAPIFSGDAEILAEGIRIKQTLLVRANSLLQVSNEAQRDEAAEAIREMAAHLAVVEKYREEVKRPFLEMGRAIDTKAKEHCAEIAETVAYLKREVGRYEQEVQREIARQEAARRAEEARLLREQQEAARAAQKLADEAARAQREAEQAAKPMDDAVVALELEAQLDAEEKVARLEAAAYKLAEERQAITFQQAARATVGKLKTELVVEVLDLHALYKSSPVCVKLTVLEGMVKDMHRAGIKLEGVQITERPVFNPTKVRK